MEELRAYALHMKRKGFTDGTIVCRSGYLRGFARWLEPRHLLDATPNDIEIFLDGRKAREHDGPIDTRTRYGWISHLHMFYAWAVTNELLAVDPTVKIERPKLHKRLPRPMSEADLSMALECADRMMYVWMMLAAFAGMRCMEIGLMDVDWYIAESAVLLITGKGNKQRMVPCHPSLVDALDQWGLPKRGPVFTRPRGGRWPARDVSREGNLYLAGLNIRATMHQARHRFGTQAYRACRDLRLVQELMGHSDPVTTAGYVAYCDIEARAAIAALPVFQQAPALAD